MAVLAEIVRNVLVIVIMASFLELLLPDGAIRPFVRFAIGLFILIAVLNPTLSFLFSDHDFNVDMWDYQFDEDAGENIINEGQEINEQIVSQHTEMLKEKLEGQINAVVLLVPGVEDVDAQADIETNGSLNRIQLIVIPQKTENPEDEGDIGVFFCEIEGCSLETKQQIEKKIGSVINNMYGLDAGNIEIIFEGG